MANEDTEAMQMIIMCGQALIPVGRELAVIALRALSVPARGVARAGKTGLRAAVSHAPGLGDTGLVGARRMKGVPTEVVEVTDGIQRPDLRELSDVCRRNGVSFTVLKDRSGRFGVRFAAADAEFMRLAMVRTVKNYLPDEGEAAAGMAQAPSQKDQGPDGAAAAPRESADEVVRRAAEVCPEPAPGQAARKFTRRCLTWTPVPEEGVFGKRFVSHVDSGSRPLTLVASTDGSWEVRELGGDSPTTVGGMPVCGRADASLGGDLFAAIDCAVAAGITAGDGEVMRENSSIEALRPSPADATASLGASEVISLASARVASMADRVARARKIAPHAPRVG